MRIMEARLVVEQVEVERKKRMSSFEHFHTMPKISDSLITEQTGLFSSIDHPGSGCFIEFDATEVG